MKTLFESKLITHKADLETSFEAAEKMIKSGALSRQENKVLDAIFSYLSAVTGFSSNFTAKDIFASSTVSYYTIQRRLSGLYRKGKIERVTKGYEFVKRNGCCVWQIVGSKL